LSELRIILLTKTSWSEKVLTLVNKGIFTCFIKKPCCLW